ncbi:MAG TPA: hypothetical protein VMF67_15710 [Rhizomicrobium sp.]|nr:hypothetical protein [Rhizomicrobium sp.]
MPFIAAALITGWGMSPVQARDGIGAGLHRARQVGVARTMDGTGRVNMA